MTSRLVIILVLTSFNLFAQTGKKAYDVYSTIIQEEFKLRNDTVDNFVFINRATTGSQIDETIQMAIEAVEAIQNGQPAYLSYAANIDEILRQSPELVQLIINLRTDNKDIQLRDEFDLNCEYNLVSRRRFDRLRKYNRLNKAREKDSRIFGAIEFSEVVFDGEYAAVYCGLYIGSLNAVGTIMILKRDGKKWKIVSRPEFWVS
jgi:hypothetical protein